MHLDTGGPDSCDAARALAEERKTDLDARIADLQRMSGSIGDLVATCDLPSPSCREVTTACPCRLYRDDDERIVPAPSVEELRSKIAEAATPSTPTQVLSAWRTRTVPMDSIEKAVHQAVLRAFAATGHPPSRRDLDPVTAGRGRSTTDVLAALHAIDALRLDAGGQIALAYREQPLRAVENRL